MICFVVNRLSCFTKDLCAIPRTSTFSDRGPIKNVKLLHQNKSLIFKLTLFTFTKLLQFHVKGACPQNLLRKKKCSYTGSGTRLHSNIFNQSIIHNETKCKYILFASNYRKTMLNVNTML